MGILAWIFGALGGLSAAMGIVIALAIIPKVSGLTWMFWFVLAANLLLISIAFAIGRSNLE